MTILDRILQAKQKEVEQAKRRVPIEGLQATIADCDPPRDFYSALLGEPAGPIHLIAEIKKASPSAGLIVDDFDPATIARTYAQHGASAISVLTDRQFFMGDLSFIGLVRRATDLPVLRKDFIIDEYQIHEARAHQADAVLLIAEAIGATRIADLTPIASELGLAVLVEVHSEETMSDVLDALGTPGAGRYLLGINNRDLAIQRTDLSTTTRLAKLLPTDAPFVSESGIKTRQDVQTIQQAGAKAMLVGESLLRAKDTGGLIDELLGQDPDPASDTTENKETT